MKRALWAHTWRSQRRKLVLVSATLALWSALLPVIYARFGVQFKELLTSGLIPEQFTRLGGGDIFSLPGAIALGFIHPIAICLTSVFAVGFSSSAIASERQRGTLEVALAHPISRRGFYLTLLAATLGFVGVSVAAMLLGGFAGSAFAGVSGEYPVALLPLLWLNGVLLFGALAAIGLAASVSFDRYAPALGVTLGIAVTAYALEIIGSIWPAAQPLQPWSLFHYLKPAPVLLGHAPPLDFLILGGVIVTAVIWALIVFPRRDLAAPS